jgi:hypothetical protein
MDDILTDFDGGVPIVTIDRPQRRNAPTRAMYDALARCLDDEGARLSRLLSEPPAREALTAFREKRRPDLSRS